MLKFFDECRRLAEIVEEKEADNISKAAQLIAESIMNGGILQAYGSGHSFAGAMEAAGRARGLIPSKTIDDPALGMYERIEGVGEILSEKMSVHPHDIFVFISNSGRNPQVIEMAENVKKQGNNLIVVTALDSSKNSISRHSSGKLLYEFADVVLDNHSCFGDAALEVDGLDSKVCGTSTVMGSLLLQQMIYEAVVIMLEKGYTPPIYKSANIDGGPEYNLAIERKYADRIFKI